MAESDPRIVAAAAWLQSDDTAYENEPDAAVRAARGMFAAAARFDAPPMSHAEIGRRLHNMVDELLALPAAWWDEGMYPTLRIGFRREDGDMLTLVVGVEPGNDE